MMPFGAKNFLKQKKHGIVPLLRPPWLPVGRPRPTHSCPTPTPDRLGTRGAALRSRKCLIDALRGACRDRTRRGDFSLTDNKSGRRRCAVVTTLTATEI